MNVSSYGKDLCYILTTLLLIRPIKQLTKFNNDQISINTSIIRFAIYPTTTFETQMMPGMSDNNEKTTCLSCCKQFFKPLFVRPTMCGEYSFILKPYNYGKTHSRTVRINMLRTNHSLERTMP